MKARVVLAVAGSWFLLGGTAMARNLLLVDLDQEASWKDMVYLAAIPASVQANKAQGGASLMALISPGSLTPEALDFTSRYRPTRAVHVGLRARTSAIGRGLALSQNRVTNLGPATAAEGALKISQMLWKSSRTVVLTREDDYASALEAAPIAGLFHAPLLFAGQKGLGADASREIRRLGAKEVICIGFRPSIAGVKVTALAEPNEAMAFARSRRLKVSYLAAVNPLDRTKFITRRLSLVGAHLAAGRGGLVAPLPFAAEWKKEFASTPFRGDRPKGIPPDANLLKAGTIDLGRQARSFVLAGTKEEQNLQLFLDQQAGLGYGGPLSSGDTVKLGGRTWSVSLGTRTKFGKTDVHLTWPTSGEVKARLEAGYRALGSRPEHLCLVGFPDALPHGVVGQGGIVEEQASDLPYGKVGQEEFATIGVGRVIAENVEFGSLYAARALAYSEILDPQWARNSAQAEWENSFGPLFENAGFLAPHHLTTAKAPPGAPAKESASQSSALTRSAVLAHSEHSDWTSLGSLFKWDATQLLAPTFVESGGCGTACLDRDPGNRSVVARLLRLGALAFSGGSRELSAQTQPLRMEFWNGLLAGRTAGQAHRQAQNTALTVVKDGGEGPQGAYRYAVQVRMLFGDPAAALSLPSKPRHAPARTVSSGKKVSVFAPGRWTVVKTFVPPDWKDWAGKDLYAVRGPGAFSLSHWGPDGHDVETPLVLAEFRTRRPVKSIKLAEPAEAPFGWSGKWFSFASPDGAFVHRFLVKMIDFDQRTGKIRKSVPRLDFHVEF